MRYIYVGGVVGTSTFRTLGTDIALQGCVSTDLEVQVCATANMHTVTIG